MISATQVDSILSDCLLKESEIVNNAPAPGVEIVEIEGIVNKFGLHRERLEKHRAEVAGILNELPDPFHAKKGGGMSFLNACVDKNDVQWGEHRNIEALVVLGIGLGLVRYSMPRAIWNVLPGGMPYFTINELETGATIAE